MPGRSRHPAAIICLVAALVLLCQGRGDNNAQAQTSGPAPCTPVYALDDGPSFERLHEVELASELAMLPRFSPHGRYLAYKTLPGGAGKKGKLSGFVTNIRGTHLHLIRADLPCPDGSGNRCEGLDVDLTPGIDGTASYASGASFPTRA